MSENELKAKTLHLQILNEMGRRLTLCRTRHQLSEVAFWAVRELLPEIRSMALVGEQTCFVDSPQPDDLRNAIWPHLPSGPSEGRDWGELRLLQGESRFLWFPVTDGHLYLGMRGDGAFAEQDTARVQSALFSLNLALSNVALQEAIDGAGQWDGLTGLLSHRAFQDALTREVAYAKAQEQHIVLVMVDADNFKAYNDTLGHPAGDALLKDIAALLKDKVRAADIVCRYGGDEFALLLKNTRKEDAARMCERIREAFQLRFGGNPVQVTASIGLACYPVDADSKQDLAEAADDALYVSKRGGRNRVSQSKTLEERRRDGPMVQRIIEPPEPPWDHPHTSPLKPPPKVVPGSGYRKLA